MPRGRGLNALVKPSQSDTSPLAPGTAPEQTSYPLMSGAEPFMHEACEVGCLLLHGYTSTPFEMRGLARYLADRGVTAGAPLLAGHGTVPEELAGKTWHDWQSSVNDALDDMLGRCKRVYLAGLSLGGALSLYVGAQRGQELAGIVAMSSPIYIPPPVSLLLRGLQPNMPFMGKPFRDIEDPEAREKHVSYDRSPVD